MVDIIVNRKTSEKDEELYTVQSTSIDHLETISSATTDDTGSQRRSEYLEFATHLMNAASNRDFYGLNKMLDPLIQTKNVVYLDLVCALHWSCFAGHVDLVNRLLDVGVDPFLPDPINYESPVYYAIKSSNAYILSIFLKRFGPLVLCHENRKFKTPFLVAVSEYTEDDLVAVLHVLEFLYLSGVSLEEQDNNGTTALMFACKRGQLFVVQWLVNKGADLSHRDHLGSTVLHYAAMGGNLDVIMFLVNNGLVQLTKVKSLNNFNHTDKLVEETPLDICHEKGNHLQYFILWLCLMKWKLMGRSKTLYSVYPILYWIISVLNLALLFPVWRVLRQVNPYENKKFYFFLLSYLSTQLFWLLNKRSNPGFRTLDSNKMNDPVSPIMERKMRQFEAVLDSLHRRQQVVNFEFYCIKKDFQIEMFKGGKKRPKYDEDLENDDWTSPLTHPDSEAPFSLRVAMCNQEISKITTEMRCIYPQVANERCTNNTMEYNNAVLNFDTANKVCLTCGKTRSKREHHCGTCNTCLVRQDHHCAWVDNCVALGNQRMFFLFVTLLLFSFLYYYHLLGKYFSLKFGNGISVFDVVLFLYVLLANGLFLIFVAYLWVRSLRSMITDVTYYEYLKKPSHIRLKYKGNVHEAFWDFRGLKWKDVAKNLLNFWTARGDPCVQEVV